MPLNRESQSLNGSASADRSLLGTVGLVWGLGGFFALLLFAIYRLTPIALDALSEQLRWWHWLVMIANMLMMAYYEGYKGFQKGYSPRVVARAWHLRQHPVLLHVLLAPFFVMAYFHSTRRRMISAWALTAGIVVLILLFTRLPSPWKGLLDAGVVLGLSWGLIATAGIAWQVLFGQRPVADPVLPEQGV